MREALELVLGTTVAVARPPLPESHRRLLQQHGFTWNKDVDAWTNRHAGRALSYEMLARWTEEELRRWLSANVGPAT